MPSKPFVSIAFYPEKIQIVKLNSQKNKVQKKGTFPIPPGIIDNYQVRDVAALTKILRDAWSQMKISEKNVGIVIPEFSTFSKLITIPKIKLSEIGEAIAWQSQEFLPGEGADMVIDWQIIEETDEGRKILVIAVHKDTLAGYIDAIGESGLLPIIVETASVSLVRVADGGQVGKLIIYFGDQENILTVAQGEAIVGSSVASSNDINYTIQTATRIVNHYTEVKVEKVIVGGYVSDQIIQDLKAAIKTEVEFAKVDVGEISPEEKAEYLIPISLQLNRETVPESSTTINLLPPMWIEHYREKLVNIRIWTMTLMSSIVVWTAFISVMGVYAFLNIEKVNVQKETGVTSNSLVAEITQEIGVTNNKINKILSVTDKTVYPESLINSIEQVKPFGITIDSYVVRTLEGEIVIEGTALDRNALISLRDALGEHEDFEAPSLPISNLVQESNIPFDLSLKYAKAPGAKKTNQPIKLNI